MQIREAPKQIGFGWGGLEVALSLIRDSFGAMARVLHKFADQRNSTEGLKFSHFEALA